MNRAPLAVVRVAVAAIALVAVGSGLVEAAGRSSGDLVDALSTFTVQSNLIGAAVLLLAAARWRRAPSEPLVWLRGGAVVYLVVTMIVYNVLLSDGQPMTWRNAVVHIVFPLYLVIDWLVDPPGLRISWGRALLWLAYPTVYVAYTFIRGAVVGWYPYPFFDLGVREVTTVALSTLGLYAIGLVVIAAVRLSGEWTRQRRAMLPSRAGPQSAR